MFYTDALTYIAFKSSINMLFHAPTHSLEHADLK